MEIMRNIWEWGMIESVKEFKERRGNERRNDLKQKKLHGKFFNNTEEGAVEKKWLYLTDGNIKTETESLLVAAQEQVISTNAIKAKIDKNQAKSKCRLCGKVDETVRYIVCERTMLARREHKRTHDWVGRKIHWEVCRKVDSGVN